MLFAQPRFLAKITKTTEHPAVKDGLEAIDYLIKEIRDYGKKKESIFTFAVSEPLSIFLIISRI